MIYDEPSTSQSAGGFNWDMGFKETLDFDEDNEMALVGADLDVGKEITSLGVFMFYRARRERQSGAIVELVKGLHPVQRGTFLEVRKEVVSIRILRMRSRFQWRRFRGLAPGADVLKTPVPGTLWDLGI
ncbi:hypothetical protein NDU88_006987 [Pleurodeles waltl]|uniref:Uncharacterized protein n=1 Tax=Pleurodeles waltl TaxID=8319 RepID=A0AAV7VNE4_PLEWA|nr:hypothetical protein NDU88_006987 [Pleurodeles waltl]